MHDINYYFLNRKLTRGKLYDFLYRNRTTGYTLDLGCGDKPYRELFPNCISVDFNPNKHPDIVADIHDLSCFANDTFDCIVCTEVLEHCISPNKALSEIFRILKPDGILLLSTRFVYPIHDTPNDYYRFTKYGLLHLLQDFRDIEIEEEAHSFETMGILLQRLAFQSETGNVLTRLKWFMLSERIVRLDKKIKNQYGNLRHEGISECVLASGYYIKAKK